MNHTATAARPMHSENRTGNRGRWTGLNIALMVLGFVVFWPLGLAMLAWIIWGDEIAAKAERAKTHFRGCADRAEQWSAGGISRTGNAAFDEYRTEELKRLEEERRKLEAMRAEFEGFLAELRRAKDQEEFEGFMREFRSRTGSGSQPSA
jgi:hypothetical protein